MVEYLQFVGINYFKISKFWTFTNTNIILIKEKLQTEVDRVTLVLRDFKKELGVTAELGKMTDKKAVVSDRSSISSS